MSTLELVRFVTGRMAAARREYAEFLAGVAELVSRGTAVELNYGTPEKLVAGLVNASRGEARRIVQRAEALHETYSVGGPRPAALPDTAAALAEGAISLEHVEKIRRLYDELPADVPAESWRIAEGALVQAARTGPPTGLNRPIAELRARLDPDGRQPDDAELARPYRELHTAWRGDRFHFAGSLDREAGLLVEAALRPLTVPRPSTDGDPDPRSTPERYGDAFTELVRGAADAAALPGDGGAAVTILLTMDAAELRDGIGAATTMSGAEIPARQVRRMACDAGVIPALLGKSGEVLDLGSRARTAPASVRNRLIVRDRGCAFPGCDRPPGDCEAHHIQHWAAGGLTVPENMALVCRHHHRLTHHAGWDIRLGEDGIPEFLPPAYIDPHRTPRRQLRVPDVAA